MTTTIKALTDSRPPPLTPLGDIAGTAPRERRPLEELDLGGLPFRLPFVRVIDDVVAPADCDRLIAHIEAQQPEIATINSGARPVLNPRVRNNDRVIFDDDALARGLYARLAAHVPPLFDGAAPVGLNERFRGYRYQPGQRFAPHFDGCFRRDDDEASEITVLVYLNEGFGGGATRLNDWGIDVVPRRGMVLLFQHVLLHEGAEVTSGTKYVLRTDVMYRTVRAR